jgi:hypothetical protein
MLRCGINNKSTLQPSNNNYNCDQNKALCYNQGSPHDALPPKNTGAEHSA